jgi:hypothetical protein
MVILCAIAPRGSGVSTESPHLWNPLLSCVSCTRVLCASYLERANAVPERQAVDLVSVGKHVGSGSVRDVPRAIRESVACDGASVACNSLSHIPARRLVALFASGFLAYVSVAITLLFRGRDPDVPQRRFLLCGSVEVLANDAIREDRDFATGKKTK